MKTIVILMIRVYQQTISRVLPPTCRFQPSCSEYGRQAIEIHGLRRGGLLTLRRLSRCHPFRPGGFDPVPSRED
jgi:putative membrane protein insertion efficiency factor